MVRTWILIPLLFCCAPVIAAPSTEPSTQPTDWNLDRVCDALQRRDRKLANCSFSFDETRWIKRVGKPDEVDSTVKSQVLIRDNVLRVDQTKTWPRVGKPEPYRTIHVYDDKPGIHSPRFPQNGGIAYTALGLTLWDTGTPLSGIFRNDAADPDNTVEVTTGRDGEDNTVTVRVHGNDGTTYLTVFLPDKDFVFHQRTVMELIRVMEETTVTKLARVDGVYVPSEVKQRHIVMPHQTHTASSTTLSTITFNNFDRPADERWAIPTTRPSAGPATSPSGTFR